ncbi:hypothetical protein [Thermococcus peptonophilus]|uniref:Uncharacterized protein n=1 Tax=Thermococcus peptonophilus TaxID=53952 RepID=A0A142CSM4_9EURY|nr:hypothetical protein [Thermococcus peptonophilus]AMQ17776.1 hypothetical protein A0127_00610 [Thermococcus peptonophilus]
MSRRLLLALVLLILIAAPLGYLGYGYSNYEDSIHPSKSSPAKTYLVFKLPDGRYLSLTPKEYVNLTLQGFKLPAGTEGYAINITGYVTGIPEVDINMTLRAPYEKFTIIIGDTNVKLCSSSPEEFVGSCVDRTAAVTEISALTSTLFKRYYYWKGLQEGMDNASAKAYAYEETMKRHDIRYLTFFTKSLIGLGRIGNKKHLAVVLLGPNEGATTNRITVPREGLIVLEGKSDSALRAEVALIEHIIGFKWPEGNQTSTG